ncbi:unnamed protein product, partial [Prorocentrum cordatum]
PTSSRRLGRSGAGGGAGAEPVEVLASQGEAAAADAAMDDALEAASVADLVGPDGHGDRSASGFSREKIRSAIAAARAEAGGDRRSDSGGVSKKKWQRLRARAPAASPRRKDTFEIMAVNGSGWGPLAQLWQEEEAGAGFVESHRAGAWLAQETRAGVKAGGARAASGGVGVAVHAARGPASAGTAGGNRVTFSDGRGIVAVAGTVRRGGLALGSICLADDTAGVASQWALVEIGDALVSQGRPRVLGGGFNAAPDALKAKAGWWQEAAQGAIAQSDEGETCFPARRDAIAGDEALQAEASESEDTRYTRALIPDRAAALPPPLETEEARWSSGHGCAALARASSAMRGAAGSGPRRSARRLGASAGDVLAAARALRWGLLGADGVFEIRTDCELLVAGFAAGKAWRCARGRPRLEVRREFWQAVGGFGGRQHARATKGNRAADGFAKKGAWPRRARGAAAGRVELADAVAAATARLFGEALQLGSAALARPTARARARRNPLAAGADAGGGAP